MKHTPAHRAMFATAATVFGSLLASTASAQTISNGAGSSSPRYFSESRTDAAGGRGGSATYAMTASFGRIASKAAASQTFTLKGGFPSTLEAKSVAPWLTAASPTFITPRSRGVVWLSGARLYAPAVSVSGRTASIVAQSPTDVAVRMPSLSKPGWHEIKLSNVSGQTTLERGIGVLPILYTDRGAAPNLPFEMVFRGTKGDQVLWALGLRPAPLFRFNNFLHGLTMDATTTRIMPSLVIRADSGEVRVPVRATNYPPPIYAQGLFLSTNPGYAPGSFSNRLEL